MVDGLGVAQLVSSVAAWWAAVVLTRGGFRWFARTAILMTGAISARLSLGAIMETTGVNL